MSIKRIAEFNYKLLHRIITCRYLVSKWKNDVTPYCLYCHNIETVEHMIFNCPEAQNIWKRIGTIMNINIKWKHVAIGYMHINRNNLVRNTVFSFIPFCIYKTKFLNSLNNPNHLNKYIITESVKREAISLIYVFKFMKQNIRYTLFDDFHKIISEI